MHGRKPRVSAGRCCVILLGSGLTSTGICAGRSRTRSAPVPAWSARFGLRDALPGISIAPGGRATTGVSPGDATIASRITRIAGHIAPVEACDTPVAERSTARRTCITTAGSRITPLASCDATVPICIAR